MKTSERTLSNLLGTGDKLYIYLANDSAKTNFMETAEKEGFSFGDGANPTERKADTVMALFDDKTICYLGFAGFMAFRHATHHSDRLIIRIDYQRYINGDANYYYDELKEADDITVKRSTTEAPSIGDGSSAFLIYDEGIQENDAFFAWLKDEGFHFWSSSKGWYSGATWKVCWIYVNLNSKLIARGIPGIRVTAEIGHHAITIDEFKAIYSIYKKYETLSPLKFN